MQPFMNPKNLKSLQNCRVGGFIIDILNQGINMTLNKKILIFSFL